MKNLKKFWTWICAPFLRFWMKRIVLPREERLKKKIMKSVRLKVWINQIGGGVLKTGAYDKLVIERYDVIKKASVKARKSKSPRTARTRKLKRR